MSIVRSQVLKEWFVEDDHYFNSHYQHKLDATKFS